MITVIIVDDEKNCRENLSGLLKIYCGDIEIIGEAENINDAAVMIKSSIVDIIFLDIQMTNGDGFQLLHRLGDISAKVVFITAHAEYAIKAIKNDAFDYLLKPIDVDELIHTIQRYRESISTTETPISSHTKKELDKIALPISDGLRYINISDIIRCQSENYYTWFFLTSKEKILVSKTLKHYETILSTYNFIRVHNSHLVNAAHILQYHTGKGGVLTMIDQTNIEVSIRKKDELMKLIHLQ